MAWHIRIAIYGDASKSIAIMSHKNTVWHSPIMHLCMMRQKALQ